MEMHHLIGLIAMFGPHVSSVARVRSFTWQTPSFASSHHLVAVYDALYHPKVPIYNLKMCPPWTGKSASSWHCKRLNTNHSGINIFLLISGRFNIVCWINTEMGLVDYLPIRPCLFLHAFLEKPNTSLISRTSKGQNLFSESICKQNNSVHWIRVPLLILYNPIELSEYRNLFLIIVHLF